METKSTFFRPTAEQTIVGKFPHEREEEETNARDDWLDEEEDDDSVYPCKQNQLPFGQQYGSPGGWHEGFDAPQAEERIDDRELTVLRLEAFEETFEVDRDDALEETFEVDRDDALEETFDIDFDEVFEADFDETFDIDREEAFEATEAFEPFEPIEPSDELLSAFMQQT